MKLHNNGCRFVSVNTVTICSNLLKFGIGIVLNLLNSMGNFHIVTIFWFKALGHKDYCREKSNTVSSIDDIMCITFGDTVFVKKYSSIIQQSSITCCAVYAKP